MDLKERLNQDLKEAMRARDRLRADTLRLALTAIRRAEVARTDPRHPRHGQPLTEADLLALLEKEVKSREEAVALYRQGGREDLAAKEEAEIAILRQYLPRPLTREEIAAEVVEIASAILIDDMKTRRRLYEQVGLPFDHTVAVEEVEAFYR
mgnify:CR=1 FL=1